MRVSLRLGLVLAIAAILAGTLLISAVLTYRHAVGKLDVEMKFTLAAVQRTIRVALEDISQSQGATSQVERLVHTFDQSRHVRVDLIGPDGSKIASSVPAEVTSSMPAWFLDIIAAAEETAEVIWPEPSGEMGRIIVTADPRNEASEVWSDIKLHLTSLALFCLLAVALLSILVGYALSPLSRLLEAFERIGTGRFGETVPLSGPSEVARLAQGFNRMSGLLREIDDKNARLNKQIEVLQEEERASLARDLHDEVGPLLFSIDVDATTIRNEAAKASLEKISERAGAIQQSVTEVKEQIRAILWQLRPAILLDLGLSNALDSLVTSLRSRHPAVTFNLEAPEYSWGEDIDATLLAVVREAVNNALRHGQPRTIDITIGSPDTHRIVAIVRNDGGALPPQSTPGSLGFTSMRERAALAGGDIEIASIDGGTCVEVRLTLPRTASDGPQTKSKHYQI